MTRAAISPPFSLPFVEKSFDIRAKVVSTPSLVTHLVVQVEPKAGASGPGGNGKPREAGVVGKCQTCGESKGKLLRCTKCHSVKYYSTNGQNRLEGT